MTNWLVSVLIPISLVLAGLLVFFPILRQTISATVLYRLWLSVPLALVSLTLPSLITSDSPLPPALTMVVSSMASAQQAIPDNLLTLVWLTGMSLMLCGIAVVHIIHRIQYQKATPLTLQQAPTGLQIRQLPCADGPMLCGLLRQTLLLPNDFFTRYTASQQQDMLAHEFCHFQRKDMYFNALALCCLALMWFNPLAWLAYSRFRQSQELACDEAVLIGRSATSRLHYAKTLLLAAQHSSLSFAAMHYTSKPSTSYISQRIQKVRYQVSPHKAGSWVLGIFLTCLCLVLNSSVRASNLYENTRPNGTPLAILKQTPPVYPQAAYQRSLTGSVTVKFDIRADGTTANVAVVSATPETIFSDSALQAVRQWRYETSDSGRQNVLVQIDYALDDA